MAVRPRLIPVAFVVVLVVLGAIAFAQATSVVRDLEWPAVDIQYRELAAAQTILDEGMGPDSTYLHERTWYSPMASWIIAGLSSLTGLPPRIVVARSGPYLNLVAPASLFLLIVVIADRYAALAGTAGFTFIMGSSFPFYYAATYSAWFAPENFGQALLFVSLPAAQAVFDRAFSRWRSVGLGMLLGLTFLVHVAPALILGLVMVILATGQAVAGRQPRAAAASLAVALAAAFVVGLPLEKEILFHYALRTVNSYPGASPSDLLDLNELPALGQRLLTIPVACALLWLLVLAIWRHADRGVRLLLASVGSTAFFLAVHLANQLTRHVGFELQTMVPSYHFFFYLVAFLSVPFGIAVRDAGAFVSQQVWGRGAATRPAADMVWRSGVLVMLMTAAIVVAYFPAYLKGPSFTQIPSQAAGMNAQHPREAFEWIRGHTRNQDVFLCTDDMSMYVVTPAARKVVATNRYFSSPYVNWHQRDRDRAEMFARLRRRDLEGFLTLAARYDVRYVVLPEGTHPRPWFRLSGMTPSEWPALRATDVASLPGFHLAYRGRSLAIVSLPAPPA